MMPEGVEMAAIEALMQKIMQAGEFTDELQGKAKELGISEEVIARL